MQTKSHGNPETKTIRISYETYTILSRLGTLEDSFDSVIKNLLPNQVQKGTANQTHPLVNNEADTTNQQFAVPTAEVK